MTFFQLQEIQQAREHAREEIRQNRMTREATLFGLLSERLDAARRQDELRKQQRVSRSGQIQILERMVELRMPIEGIDARAVNFVGANLRCAKLPHADFSDATLAESELQGAYLLGTNLAGTQLNGAKLQGARFRFADLSGANFRGAQFLDTLLFNVNMVDVEGFTQEQLKRTCGRFVVLPEGWKIDRCSTRQRMAQGCD